MPTRRLNILAGPLKKTEFSRDFLSLVLIMRGEEVVKFLDRLGRDCGLIQVFAVSHSPLEGAVFLYRPVFPRSALKQCELFLANCATVFWFLDIGGPWSNRPLAANGGGVVLCQYQYT